MIKFKIESWNSQKVEALGMIADEPSLFDTEKSSVLKIADKWAEKLKTGKITKEIFQDGLWISWTGFEKIHKRHERIRILASRFIKTARSYNLKKIGLLFNTESGSEAMFWALQGILLGSYKFDKYKSKQSRDSFPEVLFFVRKKDVTACRAMARKEALVFESIAPCREMINEPAAEITPLKVARTARETAKKYNLEYKIIQKAELLKQGYNAIPAVGQGGNPPCMVILKYKPKKEKSKKHLAIVGKGITFDSGGYCIKPGANMWEMKTDMAGAATVLYAMEAIAKIKPEIRVTGILCLAENLLGSNSYKPGDILKAKNGKTVHIDNTDAEGRLVLTDGLFYAGKEKATHIVDIATLTGSCILALGTSITGLFSNSDNFKKQLLSAAKKSGELFWELPLHEEYMELLKSPYADINNIGTRNGGSIQAALFLKEFVPSKASWIHLDIAGTSFTKKPWKYFAEGATGIGLRTLVKLAQHL